MTKINPHQGSPFILHQQCPSAITNPSERNRHCEEIFLNTYKALHLGGKETPESRIIRAMRIGPTTHSAAEMEMRLSQYEKAHHNLKKLSQEQFSALLATATPIREGGWGDILFLNVEGVTIIVKKISLSEMELQHPRATRNLFNLPTYYQYGVGSAGFGAWRELAAHEITTQWVLDGKCHNFPLMYHARVLPSPPSTHSKPTEEDRNDLVAYWDGSEAVGKREEARQTATTEIVICMEQLSESLFEALSYGKKGNFLQLERELLHVTTFMQAKGFLHFDTHFHNLLTSGQHVYFTDFGLAISKKFDLSSEERTFIAKHHDYDKMHVIKELARALIRTSVTPSLFDSAFEQYVSDKPFKFISSSAQESMLLSYRPLTRTMHAFMERLRHHSKSTPYPEQLISREIKRLTSEKTSS